MTDRAEADPQSQGSPAARQQARSASLTPAVRPAATPVEEVDGVPVLTEVRALPVRSPVVAQAAAVAATSFVAGAATVAVLSRRRVRRASRSRPKRGANDLIGVVGSRSFLVDVHLLGGRD